MSVQRGCIFALVACALGITQGCANVGVKPWERDLLATKPMQPDGYALERAADEHIYFSKEAATGGSGFGGGGCGCN